MVRAIETVQDQEWHTWRQFKAEQHKYERDLKEYNEWKKAMQKPQVKARVIPISEPRGRDLVKEVYNRFAF